MPTGPKTFIDVRVDEAGRRTLIFTSEGDEGGAPERHIDRLLSPGQQDYLDLFERMAHDLGTRMPRNRTVRALPAATTYHQPLLTGNISPDIRYGYGDPAVLRIPEEDCWYLVVTSNDAPDSFPILRTPDLVSWELAGFVFPAGRKPAWAQDGAGYSDYWAPELHKVGNEYLVCFAAREHDESFSIGIARAQSPAGPFTVPAEPLIRGGVIDAHIFVSAGGDPLLLWKRDSNELWPRLLVQMIARDRSLAEALFAIPQDQRTAGICADLWSWGGDLPPMEQFFLLQPLIEAVVDNFADVRRRLTELGTAEGLLVLEAMRTPIYAQRLLPDGSALLGDPITVLVNDLDWEAHLIEGPWLTEQDGRFYLFYSGNDFSTHEYGIGVAVADDPLGPYRKVEQPLLRSNARWSGPGHPSVAPGPEEQPHLFYHAFFPGSAGYKEFRALLMAGLRFHADGVEIDGAEEGVTK